MPRSLTINARADSQPRRPKLADGSRPVVPLAALVVVLALLVLSLQACGGADTGARSASSMSNLPTPPVVAVVQVRREAVQLPMTGSGTMAALQTSNIGALVEGAVERIFVRVGDRVRKGQPLLRIRQDDYRRRLTEAEAGLAVATAEVRQALRAFARAKLLYDNRYTSLALLDQAQAEFDVAQSRHAQARAVLGTARQALQDTVLRAPFDGVVTARLVDEGMYLNNRFSMGSQSAALQLQELRIVAAIVQLPESNLHALVLGTPATLRIGGVTAAVPSTVAVINDRVDERSRMVEVRLPVDNPDYAIKPGVAVTATILPSPVDLLVLPRRALACDSAAPCVFVLQRSRVERREVTVQSLGLDRVRVLSGLREGEQVVNEPPSTLGDGAQVSVRVMPPDKQAEAYRPVTGASQSEPHAREAANVAR